MFFQFLLLFLTSFVCADQVISDASVDTAASFAKVYRDACYNLSYQEIRDLLLSADFESQNILYKGDDKDWSPWNGKSIIDRILHSTATDEEKEMLYNLYLLRRMYSIHPIYTRLVPRKILKFYYLTPLSIAEIRGRDEEKKGSPLAGFMREFVEFATLMFSANRIINIANGVEFNFNREAQSAGLLGFAFTLASYGINAFRVMSRSGINEIKYHRTMIKALESSEKQLSETVEHLRKVLPKSIVVDYDELNKDLSEINYSGLWCVDTKEVEAFHSRLCSYEELLRSRAHFDLEQ
jgi:hypothetical protein